MESSNLVVGKHYWYRWEFDCWAYSGLLIGLTDTDGLFEGFDNNKANVVPLNSIHCEDTRQITKPKSSFFRIW